MQVSRRGEGRVSFGDVSCTVEAGGGRSGGGCGHHESGHRRDGTGSWGSGPSACAVPAYLVRTACAYLHTRIYSNLLFMHGVCTLLVLYSIYLPLSGTYAAAWSWHEPLLPMPPGMSGSVYISTSHIYI